MFSSLPIRPAFPPPPVFAESSECRTALESKLVKTPFFVPSKVTSRQRWDCFLFADNSFGICLSFNLVFRPEAVTCPSNPTNLT